MKLPQLYCVLCTVHSFSKRANIEKMDFPDPEEEFEMMYADELEVMQEMEGRLVSRQCVDV